jgi:hypothetical protein
MATILKERTILGDGGTVKLDWLAGEILEVVVNDQHGEFKIGCKDGTDALDKFEHPYAHDTRKRRAAGGGFQYTAQSYDIEPEQAEEDRPDDNYSRKA